MNLLFVIDFKELATLGSLNFIEIEHKFIVPDDFDLSSFKSKISKLKPIRQTKLSVTDSYYVLKNQPDYIYRHRFDSEIQQLTVKSVKSKNGPLGSENGVVRTEINLPIDRAEGNQKAAISSFMNTLGCIWQAEVFKEIDVSYFSDCEIVFYRAVNSAKTVACVEFEVIAEDDLTKAFAILKKYEDLLGFDIKNRETRSLFELLLKEGAPLEVRNIFLKR